jgi:hypothetical protein
MPALSAQGAAGPRSLRAGQARENSACPVRFPFPEEVCHVADRDRRVTRAG